MGLGAAGRAGGAVPCPGRRSQLVGALTESPQGGEHPWGRQFWAGGGCPCPLPPAPPSSLQPTNFTNPVYATLYMGAHNSRNSLASTDEKRELLARGDDDLADPLA